MVFPKKNIIKLSWWVRINTSSDRNPSLQASIAGWDASCFHFPSDVEEVTMLPFVSDGDTQVHSKLVTHYAMRSHFHGAVTTLLHNLPSPFLLNWFYLIRPQIQWCRWERGCYLYLRNLRPRELRMTPRIFHGFVEIKGLQPTLPNSNFTVSPTLRLWHTLWASFMGLGAVNVAAQECSSFCHGGLTTLEHP